MYLQTPVMIPKVRGITYRTKGNSTYVLYELERRYDPERQFNVVDRCDIGIQLPRRPELMLPNDNYIRYFGAEGNAAEAEDEELIEGYEMERKQYFMLRDLFDYLYFEFQAVNRKKPEATVSEYKIRKLNRVLDQVREMLQGEDYAEYLEAIPEPETRKNDDGSQTVSGLCYSDVGMMLSQYKIAMKRFFQKKV